MFLILQYRGVGTPRVVYAMEEPREQCTAVFAFNATEPASGCVYGWRGLGKGGGCPILADSVTIYAKTTVHCSLDSSVVYTQNRSLP
jgi:hypothetical protein